MNRKTVALKGNDKEHIANLVCVQLVSCIDEYHLDDCVTPIFRLWDLAKLYNVRLEQLGGVGNVHSTRLKEQLLAHFPDMRAHDEGRYVLLMFDYDIVPAVSKACQTVGVMHCACRVLHELFAKKLSNPKCHSMEHSQPTARSSQFRKNYLLLGA
jgi:hypothetical protein